jgi:hypothetical protein
MLGVLLHAPRGPFYSPKAARSRWRSNWKAIIAFCRVAHRTVRCSTEHNSTCLVPDLLPFLAESTVGPSVPLAHRTLYGAHRTVRCDQPTVGAGHTSPADCVADRWLRAPLGHRTVQCTPNSPVNFSRGASAFSREQRVRRQASLGTGHCPVHHWTVRCTSSWCCFG